MIATEVAVGTRVIVSVKDSVAVVNVVSTLVVLVCEVSVITNVST